MVVHKLKIRFELRRILGLVPHLTTYKTNLAARGNQWMGAVRIL